MKGNDIFNKMQNQIMVRTDKSFSLLITIQWLGCIVWAFCISPFTWDGTTKSIHPHVWAALLLGGIISVFPVMWAKEHPGETSTRHIMGIAQMLISGLIIHISGGKIESHFHVFGSLAFLAFYRDPWVLVSASMVTILDHIVRGYYWPESLFGLGVDMGAILVEHSGWVVFQDACLIYSCLQSRKDLELIADKQASLEKINSNIEREVHKRTIQLANTTDLLEIERFRMMESSKMASLGEMAAGIAHEINNPLAAIQLTANELEAVCEEEAINAEFCSELAHDVVISVLRIAKIVSSLRSFARDGKNDPFQTTSVDELIDETLELCRQKFKNKRVDLRVNSCLQLVLLHCRPVEISQVILNLLQNALDAVEGTEGAWVEVAWAENQITITDSGKGVPQELRQKVFQPFFTTKEVGKGTGIGLAVSQNIMESHGGKLEISSVPGLSRFILKFAEEQNELNQAS